MQGAGQPAGIRSQVDSMLEKDYQTLRAQEGKMDRVLHTNTAVRNDLLGNYVKVVERDYDLPNPLVHPMGIRRTHAPTQTATNLRTSQAQSTPRHQEVNRGRHSQQRLSLTQQPKTPVQRPSSIPAPYPGTPLHSPQSTPLQTSLSQTIARQQAPTHSYRRTTLPSPRPVVTSPEHPQAPRSQQR